MASRKTTQPTEQQAAAAEQVPTVDMDAINAAAQEASADHAAADFHPADFEHAESVPANTYEIHADSLIEGALFVARQDAERKANAPQMTGTLRVDGSAQRIPFAGFLTTAKETGEMYLRLSAGVKDGPRYYGRLFSSRNQNGGNGADYFGYLTLLPVMGQQQFTQEQWEAAPTLRLRGVKRRNATSNTARIQVYGAPVKVGANELPI